MRNVWRWYVAVGAVIVAAYVLIPSAIARDVVYVLVGASTAAAILAGVRVHRPRRRAAWVLLAAGQMCWVVGDAVYSWYGDVLGVDAFPSAADAFYLVAYVVIGAGLVVMARTRRGRREAGAIIDATVVAVSLGLVSWLTLAGPTASDASVPVVARVVGAAYPLADILVLAILVHLVLAAGSRTVAFRLLVAAMIMLAAADTAFTVWSESPDLRYLDLLWLGSYVLWGAAGLHPSMRAMSEPGASAPPLSRARLVALGAAVLVAPLSMAVQLVLGVPLDAWPVVGCSVVLFLLVAARLNLAVRQAQATARERDAAQGDLAHLAGHDALTDVLNRGRVLEGVEAALERSRRTGDLVGLLVLDIDHFKAVNDTYGQAVGDEVLREQAARVRAEARPGDLVGRLGGDEFVVLVEGQDVQVVLLGLAERLVVATAAPFVVDGASIATGASVGLAFAVGNGPDADALVFEAQAAVHRAKALGRARVEIFDEELRREYDERRALEAAIRLGLEQDEFVVHYQPVVRVDHPDEVAYYEALVRWERPGGGRVWPSTFIPVAEMSDLICELDSWVLLRAASEVMHHPALAGATVAVNISGRHLAGSSIVSDVAAVLEATGLPPRQLVLEITETVLVDRPGPLEKLQSLRALGVKISIDDFGTGYTSIAELRDLCADSLKIDRSLVASAAPGSAKLVELVVHAAHAFGLAVVGEGVEEDHQLARLAMSGCDLAQGYLFARPQPARDLRAGVPQQARRPGPSGSGPA